MKTTIKTSIAIVTIVISFTLSSFTTDHTSALALSLKDNWDEYNKVSEFVYENICKPISEELSVNHANNMNSYISRCPSGYNSHMTTKTDSVKPDRFVNGKIVFYKGCSPKYICDFKVCVAKNFIVVKNKEAKEWLSVNEWLKRKKEAQKAMVKS
jgi:hypothetical protein